ncbi:MAG: DUF2007 domain-containing protein [Acidobacteriota bacterium]|nr:DUF2007 domain-containing protein [Acidobacteriota bacterium]
MRKRDAEWVAVASTGQDEEALLIAGFLQSRDIPVEVEGPKGGSPWPENLGAFGMSRVMVPPDRAEEAKALLARREREGSKSGEAESE